MSLRIPDGESEHAPELCQATLAPSSIGFQDNFRIRVAGEANAFGLELLTDFGEVINLAVVNDPITAFGVLHRLMTERREINNGKPTIAETDLDRFRPGVSNSDGTRVVRSAVSQ